MGRKKKENSTAETSTGKRKHVQQPPEFGLHMGKIVNQYILNDPDLSIEKVGKRIDSAKTTLANKFKAPHYGTIYDLIKISIGCEHDFLSYAQLILRTKGVDIAKVYTETEYKALEKEIETLKTMLAGKIEENETLRMLNKYLTKDLKEKA
jgi:hypothetical protein